MSKMTRQEIVNELWRRGELKYKCHAVQKEMYELYYNSAAHSTLVWLLARQSGKSFLLAILALEAALRKPNSVIKLVTDTKIHVKSIFEPIFNMLTDDCPEDFKPKYSTQNYSYHFTHNNSQIQLAGSDGKHYEKLRGQKSDLVLVDEAGFCRDLDDMVTSVLLPTTTHTGGKIILATTPPADPEHPFIKFLEKAELDETLVKKTIYDNPLLKQEAVDNIISQMGGIKDERFRREYLCEIIRSEDLVVIPEFTPELEKQIVREWDRPPYFDSYVAMDLGFQDLTAVLFGYYDFRFNKVVIEDELVVDFNKNKANIQTLTNSIIQKEEELWTNKLSGEKKPPHVRVSDINPIVTNEISKYSNYTIFFQPARKDDKHAAINNMRSAIGSGQVIINPKCVTLIRHLRNVKWKNKTSKDTFARSADDGHYDCADALCYILRAINFKRNPYPSHYQIENKNLFVSNHSNKPVTDPAAVFRKIFKSNTKKYGF
jgi:hypothetical protein